MTDVTGLLDTDDEEPSRPGNQDEGEEWTGAEMDRPGVFVCEEVVDGNVCGKSFGTKRALSGHTTMAHRARAKFAGRGGGRKSGQGKSPKAKAPPKAQPPPSDPTGARGDMYGASLVMAATMVYLAAGQRFDEYDLNIVTRGAPAWGSALDGVGEKHEAVRAAADAILGGAGGIIYFQLLVTTGLMVLPILAHHGVIPPEVGERFASLLGVMLTPQEVDVTVPPPPASTPPGPGEVPDDMMTDRRPSPDPENWTLDEWKGFLFSPTGVRIMGDVMADMGIAPVQPATVIDIPDFSVRSNGGPAGTESENQDTSEADDTVPAEP